MSATLPKAMHLKQQADRYIRHSTRWAVLAGLLPVPGVDLILLQRLQISLIRRLTTLYQRPFSHLRAKSLLTRIPSIDGADALVVLQGLGSISKVVPGYGVLVGVSTTAISGGIGTYSLGQLIQQHFARGGDLSNFTLEPQALVQAQEDAVQTIASFDEIKAQHRSPQVESPQVESPQVESPQVESPQVESPQVEPPQVESPPVESPQVESPPVEPPPVESPQVEPQQVEPPQVEPELDQKPPPSVTTAGPMQAPPLQPQISPSAPATPHAQTAHLQFNELSLASYVDLPSPKPTDHFASMDAPRFEQRSSVAPTAATVPATAEPTTQTIVEPPPKPSPQPLEETAAQSTQARRWPWWIMWLCILLLLLIAGGSAWYLNSQQKFLVIVEPMPGHHDANGQSLTNLINGTQLAVNETKTQRQHTLLTVLATGLDLTGSRNL